MKDALGGLFAEAKKTVESAKESETAKYYQGEAEKVVPLASCFLLFACVCEWRVINPNGVSSVCACVRARVCRVTHP